MVVDKDGIVARYRNKIIYYNHQGVQIGADAITGPLDYKWFFSSKDRNLLINAKPPSQQIRNGQPGTRRTTKYVYELHTLSKNGKAIHGPFQLQLQEHSRPLQSATLIDGWLVVSAGNSTFAVSLPPE